ncbi:hypothetical protein M3699_11585 [Peribacillus simplex]|uniref:hypothetical protein n=1 Tax=Peribacillus simplex TaxID=1478 RepID=UPI00203EEB4B|nr:hypothetical protein [Peribacillus simplex]MCM3674514.1 hypothetical protein [Peribacillus simplex]
MNLKNQKMEGFFDEQKFTIDNAPFKKFHFRIAGLTGFGELDEDEGDLVEFLRKYMPAIQKMKYGKTCIYTMTLRSIL